MLQCRPVPLASVLLVVHEVALGQPSEQADRRLDVLGEFERPEELPRPKVRQMRMLDKHLQTRELKRDEVRDPPTESEQFGVFKGLVAEAILKKYNPKWIGVRFKIKFGMWPKHEFWAKGKASRRASG